MSRLVNYSVVSSQSKTAFARDGQQSVLLLVYKIIILCKLERFAPVWAQLRPLLSELRNCPLTNKARGDIISVMK
jgi:hypothetical protein